MTRSEPFASPAVSPGTSAAKAAPMKVLNTATILEAARDGKMLSPVEALHLLQLSRDEDLVGLQQAANEVRQRQVGDAVFYGSAVSLYLTNYCELDPALYDYPCKAGDERGYVLSIDGVDELMEQSTAQSVQQVYISGGGFNSELCIPGLEAPTALKSYAKVLSYWREHAPHMEITGFSPDEIEFLSIVSNRDAHYLLEMFQDLGLRVLGGNGAEILVDAVRQRISPKKATVKRWFEIVSVAQSIGLPVQARLEAGPLETWQQRVSHLEKLRHYIKASTESAPNPFPVLIPQMWGRLPAALMAPDLPRPQVRPEDRLKLTAVMRLFLGEVLPDQQVFWTANGVSEAQDALQWGANGLGDTNALANLAFLSGARSSQEFTGSDFKRLIEETGRTAVIRSPKDAINQS